MTEEQFAELRSDLRDLRHLLVGNPEVQTTGIKQQVEALQKQFTIHEGLDQRNFDTIFDFQKTQKLLFGFSRWAVGMFCSGLVLLGGLISWAVYTFIAIIK